MPLSSQEAVNLAYAYAILGMDVFGVWTSMMVS